MSQYPSEYWIWVMMRQRCRNPRSRDFKNYGGRGIKICDRWEEFEAFMSDMGPRPSSGHTIERKNNDGDYEPGNCRWATRLEQGANLRKNLMITAFGKTQHLQAWAQELGLHHSLIQYRLRQGWPVEKCLSTEKFHRGRLRGAGGRFV